MIRDLDIVVDAIKLDGTALLSVGPINGPSPGNTMMHPGLIPGIHIKRVVRHESRLHYRCSVLQRTIESIVRLVGRRLVVEWIVGNE